MKINFRKISAIAASALMTGMTMGVAAAANYPAPFVSGGVANVAVVYGTGTGVSSLDLVQAGNIQDSLGEYVTGGSVVVEGGDSFTLEKRSSKFYLGDSLNAIYPTLDDGEMVDFLADGVYDSGEVEEDYEQTITLHSKDLELFTDREYNDREPTVGFVWTSSQPILDYTITFDSEILWEDIALTDMPLMGKEFYVLTAEEGAMELLDSAEKTVLAEGDSVTIAGKRVEIAYIESNAVKFQVDGVITKTLAEDGYAKLSDGSYIVANDIMFVSKESGTSKVEFSIGAGQIMLEDGQEIEVNGEAVEGLVAYFDESTNTSANGLNTLALKWNAEDKTFLTEENAITMPVPFEKISLAFGGLSFPSASETVALEPGDTITLVMDNFELPFIYWDDGTDTASFGEYNYPLILETAANATVYADHANATDLTGGIEVERYDRFLATLLDTDLSDIETGYFEVTKLDYTDFDTFTVTIKDLLSGETITFENDLSEPEEFGEIEITLEAVTTGYAYFTFESLLGGTTTIEHNIVVSEKGLMVTLPVALTNIATTGVTVLFDEQDKNGDVGAGTGAVVATITADATDDVLSVTSTDATPSYETSSKSKIWVSYVESELASKVTLDKSGSENVFEIEYYGEEVTAEVNVVGGAATITSGTNTLGNVLVKDTEVSSVATKNLIVVGGSCINSAAAALVGGTKCGAAWTEATGIGSGQFLIKGYADSTITSELALLVAGYDAEDTVKATTYLTNKVVDTSKAYRGTTSTETAVVMD